jgi:hypothetical protein
VDAHLHDDGRWGYGMILRSADGRAVGAMTKVPLQENMYINTEFKIIYWQKIPPQCYWQKNLPISNKLPPIPLSKNKNLYYILTGRIIRQKI